MKRKRSIAVICLVALLTQGCASMFHGTNETIQVRSEEPDTRFFCGTREIGKGTVAITTIPKSNLGSLVLRAEKKGCNPKTVPIETKFDPTTLLGIFIDYGIVSILLIDWAANGAVVRAVQNDYILTPECPEVALSISNK